MTSFKSVDRFIRDVKSGMLLEQWSKLPLVQRARVWLLVKQLDEAFVEVESASDRSDLMFQMLNISHTFGFLTTDTESKDSPFYALAVEQEQVRGVLRWTIERIRRKGNVPT